MSIESSMQSEAARSQMDALSGKYLTFALGTERYGVGILKVQEIIGASAVNITAVPKSPDYLRGVINLRGRIIPVIGLRTKLGFSEKEIDMKTCFIVVNTRISGRDIAVGVVVDTVLEVLSFSGQQLQAPPDYGVGVDTTVVTALGKIQDKVVILIDIDKVLDGAYAALAA